VGHGFDEVSMAAAGMALWGRRERETEAAFIKKEAARKVLSALFVPIVWRRVTLLQRQITEDEDDDELSTGRKRIN
jgi:hypothetical protein